jgi:hypothetical protein
MIFSVRLFPSGRKEYMSSNIRRIIGLALAFITLASCGAPSRIARHPEPSNYNFINSEPTLPPPFNPHSSNPFQIDFRSSDLSGLDLSNSLESLLYADYDSQTVWPPADRLPASFDPQAIMELGKDPGLGLRELHEQGITGEGVAIAIIDQTLLVDHQEYKDRLRLYEESAGVAGSSSMHGPAVASIAVGKTVGVAPGADLYFLADNDMANYSHLAASVRRIVAINQDLPDGHKIQALSMSIGWMPDSSGYEQITAAVEEAKAAGIFVVSVSLEDSYGWIIMGMGRSALADPNDYNFFAPSPWWSEDFFSLPDFPSYNVLLIPMDARTTASPTGVQDYAFYGIGGMSWTAPYLAGLYALAAQVKTDITPEEFWSIALATGRTIQIEHEGDTSPFGVIADPQALIATLQQ